MIQLFLVLSVFSLPAAAASEKTIYGVDSRQDFYEVTGGVERGVMFSAVSLMKESVLKASGPVFRINGKLLGGAARGMCPGERFFEQKTAAFCSGTLIAPDLVLTAGHCMGERDKEPSRCGPTRFVFGFSINAAGGQPEEVPAGDVYSCAEVKFYAYTDSSDYAIVRLDRPVAGRRPAVADLSGPPAAGTPIFTVGGAYGLPLKVVDNAVVRIVDKDGRFFRTNLDTSGGNSGGGVFNGRTGLLVGVHTASADPDLVEIPLPAGHALPATDPRVVSGKCKVQAEFGQDEGKGKRAVPLSTIPGLREFLSAGGKSPDAVGIPVAPLDMDGVRASPVYSNFY